MVSVISLAAKVPAAMPAAPKPAAETTSGVPKTATPPTAAEIPSFFSREILNHMTSWKLSTNYEQWTVNKELRAMNTDVHF